MTSFTPFSPTLPILPSCYRGSNDSGGLMSLPNDVLKIIANKTLFQQQAEFPLNGVCRRLRHIVQENSKRTRFNAAVVNAIRIGSLSLLKWYYNEWKFPFNPKLCEIAARNRQLAILEWLRQGDEKQVPPRSTCPWDENTCAAAARGGHLSLLQWARDYGCPWNATTCAAAAKGGHLIVLQWARQNNCPWDTNTCMSAAFGGHLAVLQWARQNDCPWDIFTCLDAAEEGHLDVLQWARQNGCPWDSYTIYTAAAKANLSVLQWVLENNCPSVLPYWVLIPLNVQEWLRQNKYL